MAQLTISANRTGFQNASMYSYFIFIKKKKTKDEVSVTVPLD